MLCKDYNDIKAVSSENTDIFLFLQMQEKNYYNFIILSYKSVCDI